MSQGKSLSPNSALKHWTNLLHQWENKRSRYQSKHSKTKDPTQQIELQEAIKTCNDVIQTCQGLIQTLTATELDLPSESTLLDSLSSSETPTPEELDIDQPSEPLPSDTQSRSSDSQEIDQIIDQLSESQQSTLPQSSQRTDPSDPSSASPSSTQQLHIGFKQVIGGVLPILIIAAALVVIFRPRNICTIAPDGTYSSMGLAMWVEKAIQDSAYSSNLKSIAVAQLGCTIILKGVVPSLAIKDNLIEISKNIEIPDQTPIERFKRQFHLGENKFVKPVAEINSELKVDPRLSK